MSISPLKNLLVASAGGGETVEVGPVDLKKAGSLVGLEKVAFAGAAVAVGQVRGGPFPHDADVLQLDHDLPALRCAHIEISTRVGLTGRVEN